MNTQKQMARNTAIAVILIAALFGFEIFNFDTTRYALKYLFGELTFAGFAWGGILAFAFCGIDFAGLVRLFTPEQGRDEPNEVWLLMGAWLLGATMNAMMTWYTVSIVIANRPVSTHSVSQEDMLFYAPVFVAFMVWLTRLLFIGSNSIAAERLVGKSGQVRTTPSRPVRHPNSRSEQATLQLEER